MYLNFCAIGIQNAQLFDQSFSLSRRLQVNSVSGWIWGLCSVQAKVSCLISV